MNTTPIEFMAWDKKRNDFIAFGVGRHTPKFLGHINPCMNTHEDGKFSLESKFYYGRDLDLVYMQRTALRSINDEPIYNHMIVVTSIDKHYLVDMFNYELMLKLQYLNLKIVGNRFQHPELLELCK